MHSGPPTLTPVDRNKAYCFHELPGTGAKFAGSVGHPMTKMLSAFSFRGRGSAPGPRWGLCPQTPGRYRLVLRTRQCAPQPLTPSAPMDESKLLTTPSTVCLVARSMSKRVGGGCADWPQTPRARKIICFDLDVLSFKLFSSAHCCRLCV